MRLARALELDEHIAHDLDVLLRPVPTNLYTSFCFRASRRPTLTSTVTGAARVGRHASVIFSIFVTPASPDIELNTASSTDMEGSMLRRVLSFPRRSVRIWSPVAPSSAANILLHALRAIDQGSQTSLWTEGGAVRSGKGSHTSFSQSISGSALFSRARCFACTTKRISASSPIERISTSTEMPL